MKAKEVLLLNDTVQTVLVKLSEGNPGALSALCEIAKDARAILVFLTLDSLGIRGSHIWLGFNNVCKRDVGKFIVRIMARDKKMLTYIRNYPNAECPYQNEEE